MASLNIAIFYVQTSYGCLKVSELYQESDYGVKIILDNVEDLKRTFTFFMNSSLVTIEGKLDSLTASFWHNLGLIYSQISQLWVSTKGLGGWPTSDFASLQFINTLLKR